MKREGKGNENKIELGNRKKGRVRDKTKREERETRIDDYWKRKGNGRRTK